MLGMFSEVGMMKRKEIKMNNLYGYESLEK